MYNQLKNLKPYAILLLIMVIAYLPVSTFYFGMKNDAFTDNFPDKLFLSEALHSGHLSLWNPYMNFGYPVYADFGFAFYNPITWLFALMGYNAYSLTTEVLLYVYLGGVFMYRLGRHLQFTTTVSIAIAAMYMCCGFYLGCFTFINYLTAAAFLPLAVHAILKLANTPCLSNSFLLAVAVFFVFAGGHPYIPTAFVYFAAFLLLLLLLLNRGYRIKIKPLLLYFTAAVVFFMLLWLPALYSYGTILPYFGRNYVPSQALNVGQGFTVSSYISFLFPFSTITEYNIFGADTTMRNGYFGVVGFICALMAFKNAGVYARVFSITALFMLIISIGGPLKAFIFSKVPFFGYVTHNGEFRVFSILCFCITAGFTLQKVQNDNAVFKKQLRLGLCLVLATSLAAFVIIMAGQYRSISAGMAVLWQQISFAQKVKTFLAGQFYIFLLISTIITSVICVLGLYTLKLKKHSFTFFTAVIITDVVINSVIYLPVTGVGQTSLKTIQGIYDSYPKGMPIPALVAINKIDTLDAYTTGLVGDATYYNKLIGTTQLTDYPSYFASINNYFNNNQLVAEVSQHPYLFVKNDNDSTAAIVVKKFSPENILINVNARQDDSLVFLQNNYKFWRATVNGNNVPIASVYQTFMAVKINKGTNVVVFYYKDAWLGIFLLVSFATFATGIFLVSRKKTNAILQT